MVAWECPTNPREASGLDPEAVHEALEEDETIRVPFSEITNVSYARKFAGGNWILSVSRAGEPPVRICPGNDVTSTGYEKLTAELAGTIAEFAEKAGYSIDLG